MNETIAKLKHEADTAKGLYRLGRITREEALEKVKPYIDEANRRGTEIAKKHGMRHRKITVAGFMR